MMAFGLRNIDIQFTALGHDLIQIGPCPYHIALAGEHDPPDIPQGERQRLPEPNRVNFNGYKIHEVSGLCQYASAHCQCEPQA
jgi:hypothetical protein